MKDNSICRNIILVLFINFILIYPLSAASLLSTSPVEDCNACCSGVEGAVERVSPEVAAADLARINSVIQEEGLAWVAGETSVSDLTSTSFQRLLGDRSSTILLPQYANDAGAVVKIDALPASFDWRYHNGDYTTPVRDQKNCGSCWAFAATAVFESYTEISKRRPGYNPDFAEQYLLSCNREGMSCNGGSVLVLAYFVDKAGKTGGVGTVVERAFPYLAADGRCKQWGGTTRFSVPQRGGWNWLYRPNSAKIKDLVYTYGPVYANMYVDDEGFFAYYTSGIFEYPDTPRGETNHAITIVGWGHDDTKNRDYYIAKNSWGKSWGENGWFKIYVDTCNIGNNVGYLKRP